jgi:hemoglobin
MWAHTLYLPPLRSMRTLTRLAIQARAAGQVPSNRSSEGALEGMAVTHFEEIGGEIALAAIIDDFVERICQDTMIGFLFAQVNKPRLKRMEYEHAAAFLGAPVTYSGRDLSEAHRRHPIMGGHFGRRRQILKTTLERHAVPAHVIAAWLAHQDALRTQITGDELTQCNDEQASARVAPEPNREDER